MENIGSPPGKEITFINFDVDWQQEAVVQGAAAVYVSNVSRLYENIKSNKRWTKENNSENMLNNLAPVELDFHAK